MADYLITQTHQLESLKTDRLGKLDTVVFYTLTSVVGGKSYTQQFTLRIEKDNPSDVDIRNAVQADAAMKSKVVGFRGTV